jgi:hypothetical protein
VLVTLGQARYRHRQDLLVAAGVVLHLEHADGAHVDDGARNDRSRIGHQHIDRVAIVREGVGHA